MQVLKNPHKRITLTTKDISALRSLSLFLWDILSKKDLKLRLLPKHKCDIGFYGNIRFSIYFGLKSVPVWITSNKQMGYRMTG